MIIRDVTENDAEAFKLLREDLERSGFMLHEPGEKVMTVEEERMRLKKIVSSSFLKIRVAEIDSRLAGQITVVRGTEKRKRHSAYLALGVHSDYRRQGIAGRLMDDVINEAEKTGIRRLELTVIKQNVNAKELYEKKGFKVEGEKVASLKIAGEYINEYYMYKLMN